MAVAESTIRKMTRLAKEHGAINLSQGFPNEAPPESVRMALAYSVLTGQVPPCNMVLNRTSLVKALEQQGDTADVTNQYSPPMGRRDVQQAVASYYCRLYSYNGADPDHTTLTLGATEAVGSALRTIGKPGDKVVILEPFHELYPNQCKIFYLEPTYVTLREVGDGEWKYDKDEFRKGLSEAKILLLNSPHNPTGKVFSFEELREIVSWCVEFDVYIITDEIYEHMIYPSTVTDNQHSDETDVQPQHYILPQQFPHAKDRIFMCNSIGKSASATGWRLGWCLHPPLWTETYRGIHDQMVVMSPHPVQVATLTYLALPDDYFTVDLKTRYQDRMQQLIVVLRSVGFGIAQPQGAYYLFANYRGVEKLNSMSPMEAAMHMVETIGVACVPGDNFYGKDMVEGSKYLRFAACRSTSDIDAACTLLKDKLKTN